MGNQQGMIDGYFSHFRHQLGTIFSLPDTMYRKLLTVVVLDTFAKVRFPGEGNHAGFVKTVSALCDWKDGERVSLPLLALKMAQQPGSSLPSLAKEVNARLATWKPGEVVKAGADPELPELLKLASSDDERKLLQNYQHVELLYEYRCHLVHELREPGYGMCPENDPFPSYMIEREDGQDRWELCYPARFFAVLAERALGNLKIYLEKESLNPYEAYKFGSQWRQR